MGKHMLPLAILLVMVLPASAQIDYNSRIQPIFTGNCTACHGGTSGVTLSSYQAVMNSVGDQYSRLVIVPENPSDSPLYDKISTNNPQFGSRMPQGGPPLSSDDIEAIRQWIEEGALEEVATSADQDVIAQHIKLIGNYPNPFNPSTTISFQLPRQAEYTVRVYSIVGVTVHQSNGISGPGTVSVSIDMMNSVSGVYLYEVIIDDGQGVMEQMTGKMTLLK